jgi:hypothetical protein
MSHTRVIPRDFFNEAKLLKCLGQFIIEADNYALTRENIEFPGTSDPFEICMTDSGELYCRNYEFYMKKDGSLFLFTPYNSKEPYPLYWRILDNDISIFTDDGKFENEFLETMRDVIFRGLYGKA